MRKRNEKQRTNGTNFNMENYLQLGAVAVIFLFAVKEFFAYLKTKKEGNGNGLTSAILGELQKMNDNHLHSLEKAINDGNGKIVEAINNGNLRQIELLGEIKGTLSK